jgi:excisionase family DNA binding protein
MANTDGNAADRTRWITSGEAARRLDVSAETIRRWVDARTLEGFTEVRNVRRRYFVSADAVDKLRRERRAQIHPADEQLPGLRRRDPSMEWTSAHLATDQLSQERDGYRAENSALREAILRLTAAMEHMENATAEHTAALREQREALAVLVTPHSPGDGLA